MAAAARRFNCHRGLVWQYVNRDPKLRELVDELSESFTDEAEQTLFKLIREGNPAAVIFYLKTRAKDRGYSERFEIMPVSQHTIEVDLGIGREDDQAYAVDADAASAALLEQ
jgi:hypothetical protein